MHIFSNLEYSFIIAELGPKIIGRHMHKIKKIGEKIYRIKVGDEDIICELGIRLHSTNYLEQSALTDKFVEKVEKELDNGKLTSIEQINNDRIISFTFNKGKLVFEMFAQGNVIFIKDDKIVAAAKYESWSDREIKANSPYNPPKPSVSQKLEPSEKYIIVSLMKMPFGKEYALEALSRLKIDEKTPGKSLSGNKLQQLEGELSSIKSNSAPTAFYKDGKVLDFALTKLSKYSDLESKAFHSLSKAADEYYLNFEKPNPKLEKLNERLEKQEQRLTELQEEEKAFKEKGDHIYNNYEKASEIIGLAKNVQFDEIERKYKGKINKKDKSVEVEL
ncbi:NFACT family protein [Candidatus Micrarchaeota archaeon]|nr:NFACT family protein [Candidatus Micrarchaeota archaeon]